MAAESLAHYRGATVLYVGEGRGGCTASPAFFDALEEGFTCTRVVPLDPFPECFEHLFVFERRAAAA